MARRAQISPHQAGEGAEGGLHEMLSRILAFVVAAGPFAIAACKGPDPTAQAEDASVLREASIDAGDDANEEASACAPVPVEAGFFGEDGSCGKFVHLPCGVSSTLAGSGCYPNPDLCASACPEGAFFICAFPPPTCQDGGVAPDAAIYLDCTSCLGNVGRRPVGLRDAHGWRAQRSVVARYFARAAYLERASVDAFVHLESRLARFGAPASLRRAARRARRDEERHARTMSVIARRYGGDVEPTPPCSEAPISFEELAVENAVEGCVRETFAALVGLHQAAYAADARIGAAMRRTARDEVRHAELAWAVHRWALPQLGIESLRAIRRAQEDALRELATFAGAWGPEVARVAGVPNCTTERALLGAFQQTLFPVEGAVTNA